MHILIDVSLSLNTQFQRCCELYARQYLRILQEKPCVNITLMRYLSVVQSSDQKD